MLADAGLASIDVAEATEELTGEMKASREAMSDAADGAGEASEANTDLKK